MSKFFTGKQLEDKLTDIIWNAKKHIIIISPFIKLDDHVREVLEKVKSTHEVSLYIVFGKNEEYKHKSFNENDFSFFTEFKNVAILYNKDLHAKHYCNENEGLITSLNLYGYSMINNVEYGVYFSKNILNPVDKLYEETSDFTNDLIYNQSEVVYLKKPQYSNKLFGFKKVFQQSIVLFDISEDFFKGWHYENKKLVDFDLELETSLDKKFEAKPQREEQEFNENKQSYRKKDNYNSFIDTGYCIRTGEEIPFNPEKPMCYDSWQVWINFGDSYYEENYCHKTGKKSYGKTSMAYPILGGKKYVL